MKDVKKMSVKELLEERTMITQGHSMSTQLVKRLYTINEILSQKEDVKK